jgi:hypothetical protein
MFRKREKKIYPPGAFIPKAARVLAIIQLSLAFTLIIYRCSQPFIDEYLILKSQMLYVQSVVGKKESNNPKLVRNAERFAKLPEEMQREIVMKYEALQKKAKTRFFEKIKRGAEVLFVHISPYEQAWIFFSITIAILLLKKVEGSRAAVWILPLIACLYAWDTYSFAHLTKRGIDYPSELFIVENYLKEPLKENIFEQEKQLKKAWRQYLIIDWANEQPLPDEERQLIQAEKGEFHFNLDYINKLSTNLQQNFTKKEHPLFLALYIGWNFIFAIGIRMVPANHKGGIK